MKRLKLFFFLCFVCTLTFCGCRKEGCPAQQQVSKEKKRMEKGKMPKTQSSLFPPEKKRKR